MYVRIYFQNINLKVVTTQRLVQTKLEENSTKPSTQNKLGYQFG